MFLIFSLYNLQKPKTKNNNIKIENIGNSKWYPDVEYQCKYSFNSVKSLKLVITWKTTKQEVNTTNNFSLHLSKHNPIKTIKEKIEDKKEQQDIQEQLEELNKIYGNLENYDGSNKGQKELKNIEIGILWGRKRNTSMERLSKRCNV